MFTGIIEEIGVIKSIKHNSLGIDFVIEGNIIFSDLKLGDSVSVNGCCQTVTDINNKTFTVQAVSETINLTNFQNFKINDEVNLERALTLNTRLGGHLVAGHVDGTGIITLIQEKGNSTIFEISAPENIIKYMIYKGSITINGVSLTICELNENTFKVSIIPHTISNTTFKNLQVGDKVNLEPDMVAKYIEKFTTQNKENKSNITLEFLKENGF